MFELINELVSLPIVNEEVGSTLYFVTFEFEDFSSDPEFFFINKEDAISQIKMIKNELADHDYEEGDITVGISVCKFNGEKIAPIEISKRIAKEVTGDEDLNLPSLDKDELDEFIILMKRRGFDAATFMNKIGVQQVKSILVFNPIKTVQVTHHLFT